MSYKPFNRYLNRRSRLYYLYSTIWYTILVVGILALCRKLLEWLPEVGTDFSKDLDHFRYSRDVRHYLDNIKLLIEPSSPPCANLEEVAVINLVFTTPKNRENREVIRNSWGHHLPTYFIMGLDGGDSDQLLIENYMEAKQFDDLIVYEFIDHYQNLTIKSLLMLKWTLDRCPHAEFLLKVHDDVLVNPWRLKEVIRDNVDGKLVGHLSTNMKVDRHPDSRRFLPHWLYPNDSIPALLTGPSYLISGEYIRPLLKTSYKVPLINLENVYITYLVPSKLGIKVTNDNRIQEFRSNWKLSSKCRHWKLATQPSFQPRELIEAWNYLKMAAKENDDDNQVCNGFFMNLFVKFKYWD